MSVRPTLLPYLSVYTAIGGINFLVLDSAFGDAEIGPLTGRADNSVAVTGKLGYLLGEFDLAGNPASKWVHFDKVVAIFVNNQPVLDVIKATPFRRDT